MDLSNLRTSLREEEASGQRRSAHLRAAEDELNAFFRSSALGLTTLYRQGVAATKASYEKGYAHALAHVLELWDKDRDWLKGYLQRRIEAIEAADAEDDAEEAQLDQPQPQQLQQQQSAASTSFARSANTPLTATRPAQQIASDSPRHNNKRTRNAFSDTSTSTSHRNHDDSAAERRTLHRIPHNNSAASSRFSQTSAANFASSSFNFSAPLAYPSSSSSSAANIGTTSSPSKTRPPRPIDAPVIKTSNPATSRRRLQKLKGLRAGRDRIIDIEEADEDEILPDGAADDADAWTDEDAAGGYDENASPAKGAKTGNGGRGKKVVVWAERSGSNSAHGEHTPQVAEGKVLERLDRRKRRRSNRQQQDDTMMADEEASSAEVSREEEAGTYKYHS
ncbi:hypothetical protein EX895_006436 [Sporisorium graminicola]|uniref:Uncharacterized protein n=1 Tax=Sporisorium graminicola TaxID=280036 RepID=A0A4U7KKR4_9BASI|nr:hypothetical protein EX895_006436 [Sporisorium graminicola]TKY84534.1 hypothetical protein EX895_006436 [Sporisorium graminicola]